MNKIEVFRQEKGMSSGVIYSEDVALPLSAWIVYEDQNGWYLESSCGNEWSLLGIFSTQEMAMEFMKGGNPYEPGRG